ncbi:acyl-CoA thioesterase [Nonomuraea jabiensis]|uniref:acyl-CoA thioesterase n=1 Tax=Nonomuraea jabiensis TaxID=882448 RepID=UPI0036C38EA9
MTEPFSVRLEIRSYEIDPQLHLNGGFYIQYADHARFACARAAGVSIEDLLGSGLGPVNLETVIKYHRELRGGDEVDVTCEWECGAAGRPTGCAISCGARTAPWRRR